MKVLKRIHLKIIMDVLSDQEKRKIVGGDTLPEVVIYGSGTPCGNGIIYGGCQGTSARSGDTCDYIRNGYHWVGTCKGNGDSFAPAITYGWPLVTPEHPLICWGERSVPC